MMIESAIKIEVPSIKPSGNPCYTKPMMIETTAAIARI
jgi:hypothetical protein